MPVKTNKDRENLNQKPIAVIGMGCRFPGGASDPDRFWQLLVSGENAVVDAPEERWNYKKFYDEDPEKPGKMYVTKGAFLQEPIDEFDSHFFGVSPREASTYDPQQRLLLEVSWEAMENAGIDPDRLAGSDTGVFIGAFMVDNLMTQINADNYNNIGPHTATCFTMTMLSNRISYAYDLCGPSFTIDTACSSSLVATHQACRAIHNGECSMALAGGVAVDLRPEPFIVLCKAQMLAADGCSKSFDSRADGYGRGEGAGVVLLKSLSDAIRDGDPVQSVIVATGVNQDGQTQGISVPNPEAQTKLIKQVCERANISPNQIQYIEAHGTGTPLGDPIEAKALGKTIGADRDESLCIVGSAKATVGHTEAAAGVVGLIKSTLCLEKHQVPPQANLLNPNPDIPFAELGLKLPRKIENLPKSDAPTYVGINSFGYGGTNSFAVLTDKPYEEPRNRTQSNVPKSHPYLLLLSARDPQALRDFAKNILMQLESDNPPCLEDLIWTLAHRRSHHSHRITLSGWDKKEVIEKLTDLVAEESVAFSFINPVNKEIKKKTVFVCSGMGPQWWKMGQELYQTECVYREWLDQCDEIFQEISGWSIKQEMLKNENDSQVTKTQIAQPANFVLQVGLALVWKARGVVADAYVGHSVGEVSSAYLAGVLDLESALLVSYQRSRIQSKAAGIGGMLAVGISQEAVQKYLNAHGDLVSIAAINGASAITLAGDSDALGKIANQLSAEGIFNRELQVEVAYHSPTMDPLFDETIECLKALAPTTPHTPLYSTVSGLPVEESNYNNYYWFDNIRKPVKFMQAIDRIIDDGYNIFVEIGPHPVLSQNIKQCITDKGIDASVVSSLNRKIAEQQSMMEGYSDFYIAGGEIDYYGLYAKGKFVKFPSYPWQRTKQWLESESSVNYRLAPSLHPLLQQKVNQPNTTFESRINANYQNYVYDHKLKDLVVLPAAGYVEMALAAAKIHLEYESCILENLSFKQALLIDLDDEPRVQVDVDEQTLEYKIYSSTDKNPKKWVLNSQGEFSQFATSSLVVFDKNSLEQRCTQTLTPQAFYEMLTERGQNYGPFFQGVTELKYNEEEFFSKVEIDDSLELEDYLLHPCILDSAFQTFLVVLSDNVYMPVNISRLEFKGKPQGTVWVHGIVKQRDKYQAQGDITLFDEQGRVLVKVKDIICQAINREQADADEFTQLSYGVQWQELSINEDKNRSDALSCLMFVEDNPVCQSFVQELSKSEDANLIQVKAGRMFEQGPQGYQVNVNRIDEIKEVIDIAVAKGCDQILYLWDINNETDEIGADASNKLLQVIKVIAKHKSHFKLTLVTQNGQMISATQSTLALSQSASIGLARVASNELPDLKIRMLDLGSDLNANRSQIINALTNLSGDNEVAIRGEQIYVSRLNNMPLLDSDYQKRQSINKEEFKFEVDYTGQGPEIQLRKKSKQPIAVNEVRIEISALKLDLLDQNQFEASGVVSEVGSKVENYQTGDAVVGFFPGQASTSLVAAESDLMVVNKPSKVTHLDILKSFTNYVDSFYVLQKISDDKCKRSVLIHEANNLLSRAAINTALYLGFEVFATVEDESIIEELHSIGVSAIYSSLTQDFIEEITQITQGQGVDLVFNTFDNELRIKSFSLLKPFGHFVEFRGTTDANTASLPLSLFDNNINLLILNQKLSTQLKSAEMEVIKARVVSCLSSGELEVLSEQLTYSPAEIEACSAKELKAQSIKEVIIDIKAEQSACLLPEYIQNPILAENASYLVTGGLGGFGFETARWLVKQGAKYLVLVSRKGATTPETKTCVTELESLGCTVLPIAADISDAVSVLKMFAQIKQAAPPLRGIIHSAAVLDDDHIIDLDAKRLSKVMQPKAMGAWLLHQHTQEMNLDFFVLYSSMSSLIGNPRQANYVAANNFLDNLAHYRQQQGLAATSVNWGAIGSVGMAARNKDTENFLEKMGIYSLSPSNALDLLTRVLQEQPVQIALMDIDWSKWAMVQPDGHIAPRVRHLIENDNGDGSADNTKVSEILSLATEEAQLSKILTDLTEIISHILGLPLDKVYTNMSLTSMGVDSLLSMEFQAKIKSELGSGVSLLELLKSDNLVEIAQCVLNSMKDGDKALTTSQAGEQSQEIERIVKRSSDTKVLPASFSQQRLWFIDQLQGSSAEYHISATLQITGKGDIDVAEQAMRRIISRHETLRTTFKTETWSKDSQLVESTVQDVDVLQVIQTEFDFSIKRYDLSDLTSDEKAIQVNALIKENKLKAFDLSRDLMVRVTYLKLTDGISTADDDLDKDIVLFNMHHIASDGLSIGILMQEFAAYYQSILEDNSDPFEELALTYSDYSEWQRRRLSGDLLQKKVAYWTRHLDGIAPVHNLPLDYPRTEMKSHQGAMLTRRLDVQWVELLQAVAKQHQLTPFMLFQGALALLLSRHSNQSEFAIGTPVANRAQAELKPLIGMFVNTLVLRTQTDFENLKDYLAHVRETNLAAQEHQDIPFEQLVEHCKVSRSTKHTPLFQVMFTTDSYKLNELSLPGVSFTPIENRDVMAKFDLHVNVEMDATGVTLSWLYDPALFSQERVDILAQHMNQLLMAIVEKPAAKLDELSILSAAEKRFLVDDVNHQSDRKLPAKDDFLHTLIEKQARTTPNEIAVEYGEYALTYQQLDETANQLAHHLLEQGLEAGDCVGVSSTRSPSLLVSLLGVTKAGGVYVLFDARHPLSRLSYIIDEAGIKTLITPKTDAKELQSLSVNLLEIDNLATTTPWLNKCRNTNPKISIKQNDLLYVLYTSGSTGLPKGVKVSHLNVLDYCQYAISNYYERCDASLLITSPLFDISVPSLYLPLLTGGKVNLLEDEDPISALISKLRQPSPNNYLLRLTPMHVQGLLSLSSESLMMGKHVFVVGGEKFSPNDAYQLQQRFPESVIYNHYGPTETTVGCCLFNVSEIASSLPKLQQLPIGKPMYNTQFYILDKKQKLLPFGAVGELYIGGLGVSDGYVKNTELNRLSFIKNPFSEESDTKLYKTGDLAHYMPDGNLAFVGRIDDQVKIRGYRLELGEVESQLNQLDFIMTSKVITAHNETESKQLVAYVVTTESEATEDIYVSNKIKQSLSEVLPDYMVPAFIVRLATMPLTANGKIDTLALPEVDIKLVQNEVIAANGSIEKTLVNIWAKLLNLESSSVSVTSSFFEIGGHSLLAIRLVAEIRAHFNEELAIKDIFSLLTIRAIAKQIETEQHSPLRSPVVAIKRQQDEAVPCSYAQRRLWLIDQLQGGSSEYNLPAAIQIEGDYELDLVEKVIRRVIERHQPLRTVFRRQGEDTYQVILSEYDFRIKQYDLSHLDTFTQQAESKKLIRQHSLHKFNLSQDLMLNVGYIHLASKESKHMSANKRGILLFNMHHIASDGWSKHILFKEFMAHYEVIKSSSSATSIQELPELNIQYADYAHWQRQWLVGEIHKTQLEYWKKQLRDAPAKHDLPLDYPRPQNNKRQGAVITSHVPTELVNKIHQVAQHYKLTPFMLLHGALALVLSRHSNSNDIVLGTPVANRLQTELETLIGFFVNTLVLRVNTQFDNLEDYYSEIKRVNLDAQMNQDIPFEHLVENCQVPRNSLHTPLFQITFTINNNQQQTLALPGITLTPIESEQIAIKFDLEVTAQVSESAISFSWLYDTSIFRATSINEFSEHFNQLLTQIVEEPLAQINCVSMLTKNETDFLLEELNQTRVEYPKNVLIHELIESQASRNPHKVAAVYEGRVMTYAELNTASNRLAHYLIEQGVKAEDFVGICIDRGFDMLLSILAILKVGGAYVPLDKNYPESRLEYICDDTKLKFLLACGSTSDSFSFRENLNVIALDDKNVSNQIRQSKTDNLSRANFKAESPLAYVVYTSGSTGQPKGVLIEHRNVVAFVSRNQYIDIDNTSGILALSSIVFDGSVFDLFVPLVHGKTLVILPQEKVTSFDEWLEPIEKYGVDAVFMTTALFNQMSVDAYKVLVRFKQVLFGGEKADVRLVGRFLEKVRQDIGGVQLIHVYGPTEATVYATSCRLTLDNYQSTPIGKPINNCLAYVLNENQELQPFGAVGELYIGGPSLARGYLNQQDLSSEKFIRNPFSIDLQERLYKTGDLVQYSKDGNLIFVGRTDSQVKIRGFRIEPAEIESILSKNKSIAQSLVIVNDDDGDKRLIAYVVADKGISQINLVEELREYLQEQLPQYMLPSHIILLDNFPLTVNNKIDKKALPRPQESLLQAEYRSPQSETEKTLTGIWAKLLKLDEQKISTQANFFELGGHSLLAVRLIAQVREEMQRELTIKTIFDSANLSVMSAKIDAADSPLKSYKVVPVKRQHGKNILCSFAQQRIWFVDQLQGGSAEYNIFSALDVNGQFDVEAAEEAICRIIERHQVLRTIFNTDSSLSDDLSRVETVQVIRDEVNFRVNQYDLSQIELQSQQTSLAELIASEKKRKFDLGRDLLLRVSFVKIAKDKAIILFNVHHIVADGWSIGVMLTEFMSQYRAIVNDLPDPLEPLEVQYADYAYCQRNWLRGEVLEQQLNYWKIQLKDLPTTHSLMLDYQRPEVKHYKGGQISQRLAADVSKKLLDLAVDKKITPFMLVHAALSLVISRNSNQEDVVIGTPVANRTQVELERLIGCFVNTLVLRTNANHNTLDDYLAHVKQVNLEAQAHQDLPFEKLVEHCEVNRSKRHSPMFQIMLMMDTTEQVTLDIPGVSITRHDTGQPVAKFDLEIGAVLNDSGIEFNWVYDMSLFTQAHIRNLSEQLNNLLEEIIKAPMCQLSELTILSDKELTQLLYEYNSTHLDYESSKCIHQLVESCVEKTPGAVAVKFNGSQLTYRQLNESSNRLAHYMIQRQNILPDSLVGICLERSLDMVIAILAVFKAGAAYVPIDPLYPQSRVDYVLDDAGLKFVITQEDLLSSMNFSDRQVIAIDNTEISRQFKNYSSDNVTSELVNSKPDNLAYVLYTSGSTGHPKGVMVEHSSVVNYLSHAKRNYFHDDVAGSVVSSSLSFDATITSILAPLIDSKYVELLRDDSLLLAELNKRLTDETQAHLFKLTPSHLIALSQLSASENNQVAHRIVIGGEQLTNKVLAHWRGSLLRNSIFINEYGPTETTVGCSIFEVSSDNILTSPDSAVPIGRAIQNTQLYVLDDKMQPVPKGVVGELYIGGIGVARGYLNKAELTSTRFIDNPFYQANQYSSKRLYKTGDQVRYLLDGNLSFIGRFDDQVKVRGNRIELGEIEYQINRLDGVDSAVVNIRKSELGASLVAYIKPYKDYEKNFVSKVKQELIEALPNYMIPDSLVMIEEWPLTINGKVDKQALPIVEESSVKQSNAMAKTNTEVRLVNIWNKLLHKTDIGIHEDFFELGGHSMLIMQLIAIVKNTFDLELATDFIFARPTISELASGIDEAIELGMRQIVLPSRVLDLHTESILPERFKNIQGQEQTQINKVLLTGATGFLGVFILRDLLLHTDSKVICLVRGKNKSSAKQRIKDKLSQYKLWQDAFIDRIEIVNGDLSHDQLGLSEKEWNYLAKNVDAIYHNGALVNFLHNYQSLKKANVDSTLDIVRLAITSKLKRVHYVSTLSVFSSIDSARDACKETTIPSGIGLERGYAQSKWVAEHVLLKAKKQGLPLSLYRPGRITGDSVNGISNTDDFFYQMLRGCFELNIDVYPNNIYLDMTPVDYVSRAIVHLSQTRQNDAEIYHLFNPIPNDKALFEAIQKRGYQLDACDFAFWQMKVKQRLSDLSPDRLAAFNVVLNMDPEVVSKKDVSSKAYDCDLTVKELAKAGIVCSAIDHNLCELYLNYLAEIGIIPERKATSA